LGSVVAVMAHTSPPWLAAAGLAYAADLALRAWRWRLILQPTAAVPYRIVARVLVVGYGLNVIMPARLGELFRAEFFKKTYGLPRVPVLTSIVVERLFDGLAVVGCLAAGLVIAAHSGASEAGLIEIVTAGGAVFGALGIGALGFARLPLPRLLARLPRLREQAAIVQHGVGVLHSGRGLRVAALTVVVYVPEALCAWFIVKSVGFGLGFADTLVLVGAASLITLAPSGPAFLGTLQFAYVLAIEFAGGPAATGLAAATLAQLCILLPVAIIATLLLTHTSGSALYATLTRRGAESRRSPGFELPPALPRRVRENG
jgi:glycosyltransferase 2 family protein